ncbi:hypothetical protein E8P77_01185 [Soehngenia saccharolytica]|nr:hypothetical protein E8P77_01185 [Soehngenia saccharolytica]
MKDIVIITPFIELFELAKKVVNENDYENIDVIFGDLSQGVIEAKRAVSSGAKIIISRGGTYSMIKREVNVPVVEIAVTSFDLLRGFVELKGYKDKIGLVGYQNVISGSDLIGELLDLDIVKIEINREDKAEEVIKPYIDQGIKVFVGDTIGSRISNIGVDDKAKVAVATFNDITELQELENNLRLMLSKKRSTQKNTINQSNIFQRIL